MIIHYRLRLCLVCLLALLAACAPSAQSCPSYLPIHLSGAGELSGNDRLPFRFPLAASAEDEEPYFGWFGVSNESWQSSERQYHAAEDYRRPAGTPVYAFADGRVSFSGPAGGYGWLVIIDHPQANLYSLYGHLSPSRWRIRLGIVQKGDLLAYLGDPDENGGSADSPLTPHLHFGVRAGQRGDYPARGEWRWMAGWIKYCPQELGWLQPSAIIASQEIPAGGFPTPSQDFLMRWGFELLITGLYVACSLGLLIYAIRINKPWTIVIIGIFLIIAGVVLRNNRLLETYTLLWFGALATAFGTWLSFRQPQR